MCLVRLSETARRDRLLAQAQQEAGGRFLTAGQRAQRLRNNPSYQQAQRITQVLDATAPDLVRHRQTLLERDRAEAEQAYGEQFGGAMKYIEAPAQFLGVGRRGITTSMQIAQSPNSPGGVIITPEEYDQIGGLMRAHTVQAGILGAGGGTVGVAARGTGALLVGGGRAIAGRSLRPLASQLAPGGGRVFAQRAGYHIPQEIAEEYAEDAAVRTFGTVRDPVTGQFHVGRELRDEFSGEHGRRIGTGIAFGSLEAIGGADVPRFGRVGLPGRVPIRIRPITSLTTPVSSPGVVTPPAAAALPSPSPVTAFTRPILPSPSPTPTPVTRPVLPSGRLTPTPSLTPTP